MSTDPTPRPQHPGFAAPQPYAGQPTGYVLPTGYPAAVQPGGAPATARNVAGTISLILGIALIVWMFVNLILQVQAIATGSTALIGALGFTASIVNIVVALGAIGFGLAGILSRSTRKVAAGIGTGIGAMALAGALSSLLYPLLFPLFGA